MLRRTLASTFAAVAVLAVLGGCSVATAGHGVRAVTAVGAASAPARGAVHDGAPSVPGSSAAGLSSPASTAASTATAPPPGGTGSVIASAGATNTAAPGAGDGTPESAAGTSASGSGSTPDEEQVDAAALIDRMRVASSMITSEALSISLSGWDGDGPYSVQEDIRSSMGGGRVEAMEVSLIAVDPGPSAGDSAARPTMVIRVVGDRVFIGPRSLIVAVGIENPERRPWYEVTDSTAPAIAALVDPMRDASEYGSAFPLVGELVASATSLIDLGPQTDGPAAHQYQMTVDLRTVPGLLDLTPEQRVRLAGEGPLMTAYLWLDDQDRIIKLITAYHSLDISLSLIETASRFDEPFEIQLPRASEIVTDR